MKHKDATLCAYPTFYNISEPTVSINTYFRWNSPADFAVKHCNASQLFGQQLLRNPAYMLQ
jgi:hypothetical protein